MNPQLLICLFRAGEHCAPSERVCPPQAILLGEADGVRAGDNGLWLERPLRVHRLLLPRQAPLDFAPMDYDFRYFNREQRAASERARQDLKARLQSLSAAPALDTQALVPMVVGRHMPASLRLYHRVQQGEAGALFLRYHEQPPAGAPDWDSAVAALAAGAAPLRKAWPLLNDDCWYSKWRADVEMERKFTFEGLPDTWDLINTLYDEVLQHRLSGFVPELDREFQVFDYESHLYEVSGDPQEAGYIAFIPQADGRMTLKRKWFVENTEIRRESLTPDLPLGVADIAEHVRGLSAATLRRMPAFRRKRFDVNFESLHTGNVYGVYLDICRTQAPAHAFAQCEVEYCRTRSFQPLRGVETEFEQVAAYVQDFLQRQGVPFRHDRFSKLDFVREALARAPQDRVRESTP